MNTEHKIATNANMIKSTRHWVTFNCFFEVNSLEVVEVVPEVTLLASEGFTLIALEDPFNLAIFSIGMVASSASSELLAASDDPDTNPFGGCGLGEAIVRGCQLACLICRSIQSQKNPSNIQGFPLINKNFSKAFPNQMGEMPMYHLQGTVRFLDTISYSLRTLCLNL